MKFFVAFLTFAVFCLALCSAAYNKPDGQPGCQTEEEISVGAYRHYYRKNAYWVCSVQGQPAALAACPPITGWLDDAKACVPWSQWYWTPTVAPPSLAADAAAAADAAPAANAGAAADDAEAAAESEPAAK